MSSWGVPGSPTEGFIGGRSGGDLVFVSYSHADRDWLERLLVLLKPLVRNRRLDVWADPYIEVGADWRRDIDQAVGRARVAVLLVSADFLASRFIMDEELPALQAHGTRLLPVLVHECLWDVDPVLSAAQWARDPNRDGPLDQHADREGERDRRLTVLCRILMELMPVGEMVPNLPVDQGAAAHAGPVATVSIDMGLPGRLDGVPALPPGYLPREELTDIRAAVVEPGQAAVGVTGRVPGVGLFGHGGIGKTVLAAALARDPQIARQFPDGVFWVTLGEAADPLSAQLRLLTRLGIGDSEIRSVTDAVRVLRQVLADRQCLLVVDDVWSAASAAAFQVTGPHGRVVYTTRDPAVLTRIAARVEQVDVLADSAARTLLAQLAGTTTELLPVEVEQILAGTGRVALALALVGAAVRGGSSWVDVATQLERGQWIYGDHPYANTFKALQLAVGAMHESAATAYRSLAVYPPDTRVPIAAIVRFWRHLWGRTDEETVIELRALAERRLLSLDDDVIAFHDLQHNYLLLQVDELSLLHADLLAAYRALLPAGGDWRQLPAGEPYIWDHLVDHLHGAGLTAELVRVSTDPAFLVTRTFLAGPQVTEADLRRAAQRVYTKATGWWQQWFAHFGHLLTGLPTLGDAAATAASRLTEVSVDVDPHRLDPLLPSEYLTPAWGLTRPSQELRRVLAGHTGPVSGVVFSPDGQVLASASWDDTVRLWEAATGVERAILTGHTGWVNGVAFSPNGWLMASASDDATVRLWDADTGEQRAVLTGHTGPVSAVAISPDGQLLASASDDATVRLWDTDTGEQRTVLTGHTDPATEVAFSPNGRLLASASYDGTVRLWEVATGEQRTVLTGHTDAVNRVAISPDGQLLASASHDDTVRLWEVATGVQRAVLTGNTSWVNGVAIGPDGRLLASACWDATVRVWEVATGEQRTVLTGHTDSVTAVAISPDGRLLASASHDQTVRLWEMATGDQQAAFIGHTLPVSEVAFSSDGHLLASASDDATVRLWDVETGEQRTVFTGHALPVSEVAFSSDGHVLASASDDATVRLWDVYSGKQRGVLDHHTDSVSSVTFSPDGQLLASASHDTTVRLWDVDTSRQRAVLAGHADAANVVVFSPDGRLLASASHDATVRLWDVATGEERAALTGHLGPVTDVAFSPDGQLLASASDDDTLWLWEVATGDRRVMLRGHVGPVTKVAISPDGQLLASAGYDGVVRLWTMATGDERAVLTGHANWVTGLAFSPDGRLLATASQDQTIRLSTMIDRPVEHVLRLGSPLQDLRWHGGLICVAAGRSVVLFRLTKRPGPLSG